MGRDALGKGGTGQVGRGQGRLSPVKEGPMWFTQPSLSIDQPFGKY